MDDRTGRIYSPQETEGLINALEKMDSARDKIKELQHMVPLTDEQAVDLSKLTPEERIEWAKKTGERIVPPSVSHDTFIVETSDEDTKFADEPAIAAGPRIGVFDPSKEGDIDISFLSRKDRRKLMRTLGLHLIQEDKKAVDPKDILKERRKSRKRRGLKLS